MSAAACLGLSARNTPPASLQRPIGREKRIEFSDIHDIEELEYGEFVLQCSKRSYTFKAPDEVKCQIFVHNLRQLRERDRVVKERQRAPQAPVVVAGRKKGFFGF